MRILLDENCPQPMLPMLKHILKGHIVEHTSTVGWSGKKDRLLLKDASGRFDVFVTNDARQYVDPDECRAIKESGLHHVTYEVPSSGLDGLAIVSASVSAAMRGVVHELEAVDSQRLVRITTVSGAKRFQLTDPDVDPPSDYWPGRKQRQRLR